MTQVVEHLPNDPESLSLNPSTTKKFYFTLIITKIKITLNYMTKFAKHNLLWVWSNKSAMFSQSSYFRTLITAYYLKIFYISEIILIMVSILTEYVKLPNGEIILDIFIPV
jgi:hypothetical protein